MELAAELATLCRSLPLAPHWGEPECHAERVEIHGVVLELVGLVSRALDGRDVFGSAAEVGAPPLERAYFELIERAALLDALAADEQRLSIRDSKDQHIDSRSREQVFPESPSGADWVYARSNGVAAAANFEPACLAARAELVERHAILSSWFGWTAPHLTVYNSGPLLELTGLYQFETYCFPAPSTEPFEVVGVFGFPRSETTPTVYGFGAAADRRTAGARASRECLQRLGFLWGEALPEQEPAFAPTAAYHQELFLWPAMRSKLRYWLRGGHVGKLPRVKPATEQAGGYVDLTPTHLANRLRVVKALSQTELPLTFGKGHPAVPAASELLGVHPIV